MWRSLIIGVHLWCVLADSNANAGATSNRKKFPVELEADTGPAKEGEGVGGVAVLLKPMPEATTMKTWSFLKESMLKIGDNVKQILQVRNDMAMLQEDLSAQEKAWHNAEITLNQENAKLRGQVEDLERQAKAGMKIKRDLMTAQTSLEAEQRRAEDLQNEADMAEKRWQTEVKFLDDRKNNVTALHKEVNETASLEISRVEAVHLQLQKDAVTLRLATSDFQDRIKNGQEKMEFDKAQSLEKQSELQKQIAAMKDGLVRISAKIQPQHIFDEQLIELKHQLKQETDAIIVLQSEHQQIVTECRKELQEQDQVKCAEGARMQNRVAEKTQLCNAAQVQNQILKQDLAKCATMAGIPSDVQTVPGPAGLIEAPLQQPIPMSDEELQMRLPTAPAPAPGM